MGALGLGNGSLRMDDVYLEGPTPDGPAVVGHLSVVVDTAGITFLGPEPGERRTVGWERTSPLEFGPPAALPAGEQATSLEFVVDGRPLRLLVPSQKDPKAWGRHRSGAPWPGRRCPLIESTGRSLLPRGLRPRGAGPRTADGRASMRHDGRATDSPGSSR